MVGGLLADNGSIMNRRFSTIALLFCLALGLLLTSTVSACPTCKDNLGDPASANLARGFYYSILFMLSMPYLILGSIGFYFYTLVRRARREREALAAAQAAALYSEDGESGVDLEQAVPCSESMPEDELVNV